MGGIQTYSGSDGVEKFQNNERDINLYAYLFAAVLLRLIRAKRQMASSSSIRCRQFCYHRPCFPMQGCFLLKHF
jgi:hypothetical protein